MPNYRLTVDEQQQLLAQEAQIAEIQDAINAYKRAGLDATKLQQALNRVKAIRAGMLKHLAPAPTPVRP